MTTLELRTIVHDLIDKIEDEDILVAIVDFLRSPRYQGLESLWETLSEEQKKEVMLSYDESEDENNLVSKKEFFDSL